MRDASIFLQSQRRRRIFFFLFFLFPLASFREFFPGEASLEFRSFSLISLGCFQIFSVFEPFQTAPYVVQPYLLPRTLFPQSELERSHHTPFPLFLHLPLLGFPQVPAFFTATPSSGTFLSFFLSCLPFSCSHSLQQGKPTPGYNASS